MDDLGLPDEHGQLSIGDGQYCWLNVVPHVLVYRSQLSNLSDILHVSFGNVSGAWQTSYEVGF